MTAGDTQVRAAVVFPAVTDFFSTIDPSLATVGERDGLTTLERLWRHFVPQPYGTPAVLDEAAISAASTEDEKFLAARALCLFAQPERSIQITSALLDQGLSGTVQKIDVEILDVLNSYVVGDIGKIDSSIAKLFQYKNPELLLNVASIIINGGDAASCLDLCRRAAGLKFSAANRRLILKSFGLSALIADTGVKSDATVLRNGLAEVLEAIEGAPRRWAHRPAHPPYRVGFLLFGIGNGIGMPALERRDRNLFQYVGFSNSDFGNLSVSKTALAFDMMVPLLAQSAQDNSDTIAAYDLDLLVVLSNTHEPEVGSIVSLKPCRRIVAYGNCFSDPQIPELDGVILPADFLEPGDGDKFSCSIYPLECTLTTADSRDGWLFDPLTAEPPAGPPVIGSVAWPVKLNRSWFARIAPIVAAVPDCRLRLDVQTLHAGQPHLYRRWALDAGIPADRITILSGARVPLFRDRLAHLWLAVDSAPLSAFLTAQQALSAGLPLLTLPGAEIASRQAAGVLRTIGMEQLIAKDVSALQALAIELLSDRARLTALRATLPERVRASPLGDPTAGARMLEAAFVECMHG